MAEVAAANGYPDHVGTRSGGWSPGPLSSPWNYDRAMLFNIVAFKCESEVTNEAGMNAGHHQAAEQFREANGTGGLEQTLDKAVTALSRAEIPHLVTGGYAAQEYGCLWYTDNVDLIVPNIARAYAALPGVGFQPHPSSKTVVIDPETGFEVRLLAGGSVPNED